MRKLMILLVVTACLGMVAGDATAGWRDRKPSIKGSGDLVSEVREVDNFNHIHINGAFDVHVRIGPAPSLEVTFDDNLIDRVVTRQRRNTLLLDLKGEMDVDRSCLAEITVPSLEELSIGGAADVEIVDFRGETFEYVLHGAGNLTISGTVEDLEIDLHGAGSVDARDLIAQNADVSLPGAGSIDVHVKQNLRAQLTGVGSIDYWGDPEHVRDRVSGIGSIDEH